MSHPSAPSRRPHPTATPAAEATGEVHIAASPERVWALLTDIDAWPRWHAAIQRSRLQGPLAVGSRFHWRSQGFNIRSTITELRPLSALVWHGQAFGTRAVHGWRLQAVPGGVRVTTTEGFSGWLPRLFPHSMQRQLATALPAWLAALKAAAETPVDVSLV